MFSVLGLMILGCLSQIALSCRCGPRHPQTAYCDSDVVIRVKFAEKSQSEKSENWIKFKVKVVKVYKAPQNIAEIRYVHTAATSSLCGYTHESTNRSQEFLVTGHMVDGVMMTSTCAFIFSWEALSATQKMGFQYLYKKSCLCQIIPCYSAPCVTTSKRQCLWTDMLNEQESTYTGPQAMNMTCVDQGDGMCVWAKQKKHLLNYLKPKNE